MDYMREHLHEPEALASYARRCGLSVSRFSEAFREHCGVSPMTYFTELRLQRACELLDTSDLQVGEIAERLGFQDALYFSRLFRKHTGIPPTAYRKRGIG
jgi:transcriptional regulator GlxA family with amidase domain